MLRSSRQLPIPALLLLVLPATGFAQVGHDPATSPYRTLRYGQFVGAHAGWFGGSGGTLGVAPHGGQLAGFRYDFLANGTVNIGLAASMAWLDRVIIDPNYPIELAARDTVPQRVTMGEAIFQFNLTGGKTWHRLAPYVSAGFALALGARTPADTSGFRFRVQGAIIPGIGTRIYLSERLFLRLEARSAFWQVKYPESYRLSPSLDPTKPPVLRSPAKEWLANGWYGIGLSYAFNRPF
jgi:hypothetical protein